MYDVGFKRPDFICAAGLTSDLKYMYLYREDSGSLGTGEHDLAWIYLDAKAPIPVYLEAKRRDGAKGFSTVGQWVTLTSLMIDQGLAASFDFRNRGKAFGTNPIASGGVEAPAVEYSVSPTSPAIVVAEVGIGSELDIRTTFMSADPDRSGDSGIMGLGYSITETLSVPSLNPVTYGLTDSFSAFVLNPGAPPVPPASLNPVSGKPAGTPGTIPQWTFGDSRGIEAGIDFATARGVAGDIDPAKVFGGISPAVPADDDGDQLGDFRAMICSCYSGAVSVSNTPITPPEGGASVPPKGSISFSNTDGTLISMDPSHLTYPTDDHRLAGEYLLRVPATIAYRLQKLAKLGILPPDVAVIPAKLWVKDGDTGVSVTPIDYQVGTKTVKGDGTVIGGMRDAWSLGAVPRTPSPAFGSSETPPLQAAGVQPFTAQPAVIGWYQYAAAGVAIVAAVAVSVYITYKVADCYDKAKAKEAAEAVDIAKVWARQSTVITVLNQMKDAPAGTPMNDAQKQTLNDAYAGERADNKKWEDSLKQEKSAANQLAEDFGSALKTGAVVGAIGLTAYMGLKLVLSHNKPESP